MSTPNPSQNSSSISSQPEHRHATRLKMNMPVHITGYDPDHRKWQEISRILDVSHVGACFTLQHFVKPGLVLHLSFPMPWKLRQFGHSDPSYKIFVMVRNVHLSQSGIQRTGVAFLGPKPPQAYLEKPWVIFHPNEWRARERRRAARKNLHEIVWVEYYQKDHQLVAVEQGCTENISATGARICVPLPLVNFDLVKIFALNRGFEALAVVTNQFLGSDGISRLCVDFTDKQWPMK